MRLFPSSLRLKPGDCCHEGVAVVYKDHLNCPFNPGSFNSFELLIYRPPKSCKHSLNELSNLLSSPLL